MLCCLCFMIDLDVGVLYLIIIVLLKVRGHIHVIITIFTTQKSFLTFSNYVSGSGCCGHFASCYFIMYPHSFHPL